MPMAGSANPADQPNCAATIGHEDRAKRCAEVDAHVEDRESGVAARAAFRIDTGDDRADVRFQQPHTEHDHDEADEEPARLAEREQAVADHDQDAAPPDGALRTPDAIRDPATEQAEQIGAADVEAVDRGRRLVVESETACLDGGDQEQHEDRPHAVIREALPHLRHEEREQAPGVAKPLFVRGRRGVVCVHAGAV